MKQYTHNILLCVLYGSSTHSFSDSRLWYKADGFHSAVVQEAEQQRIFYSAVYIHRIHPQTVINNDTALDRKSHACHFLVCAGSLYATRRRW